MRLNECWLELGLGFLAASVSACSSSPSLAPSCNVTSSSNVVTTVPAAGSAPNVIKVTVNGDQCSGNIAAEYPNEPCASIQVCNPNTSTCKTINNLLVDTGSYGIRIFSSVLTSAGVTGSMITSGSGNLGECVGFGDDSSEFGPVENFGVILGGETEIQSIPILVINDTSISGFNNPPSSCTSPNSHPDTGPSQTGFNGILGVGLFDQDCGTDCSTQSNNGMYFSCSGTSCMGAVAAMGNQVRNPVAALSATGGITDNNGVLMMFPSVPDGGAASLTGALVMGISTRPNNMPANVQMYQTDGDGSFTSVFNPFSGNSLGSFIDSGSSLMFFPWPPPSVPDNTLLPDCGGGLGGFYCPDSEQSFATSNTGNGGSPSSCVAFNVSNANSQLSGSNLVFANLAGESGSDISSEFDWGLPFFFGRNVFVGINGKAASGLGTGPFWAY